MKKLILVFGLTSLSFFAVSQTAAFASYNVNTVTTPKSYSTTTFAKTIKAEINPLVALPCNFTIVPTKGTRTTIEVTVSANCSPAILSALATAGRYELDINTLTFPKAQKHIFVNGQDLDERISVKIFIGQDAE